jgi:hypothetical protein
MHGSLGLCMNLPRLVLFNHLAYGLNIYKIKKICLFILIIYFKVLQKFVSTKFN